MSEILVVNAGSSSIKLAVFGDDGETPNTSALLERIGSPGALLTIKHRGAKVPPQELGDAGATHAAALSAALPQVAEGGIIAVGHRVVHGGADFTASILIDDSVTERLERLVPLARTHQPHHLAAIRAIDGALSGVPQVACFDTAFHATIPEPARTLALPAKVREAGVRRYGFHGLSYRWIASQLPGQLGPDADGRVVAAHLGNGASLAGMVGRQGRATTMSFTPLDGLVMGERPGLTDPGALLFMQEELGLSLAEVRDILFKQSGLLGLSGHSNDMRTLLAADDPSSRLALAVYIHRIVREIGAMAAEIGGLDALVFTGGVGENAAPIREAIVDRLGWLGLSIDPNDNAENETIISDESSKPILIIPANEEAVIAQDTRQVALTH